MTAQLAPLLDVLPPDLPQDERALIERAYTVAAYWHRDQWRKSGDPYIVHPVAVAAILAEQGPDHELVCAGLLHDVLDDTACSREELEREFGAGVVGLLTGLGELEESGDWACVADPRVLVLKLADRLHNQRTIRFLDPRRRLRKSRESLEVLAPMAGRLGLERIGDELAFLARESLRSDTRHCFQAISAGALLLPRDERARWVEEWSGELQALPDRGARRRFAAQVLVGMPRMAAALRRPATGVSEPILRALRWLVRTDLRAWTSLAPLVGWMIYETAADGLVSALVLAISLPPVLAAGIKALRGKLGDP